MRILFCKIAHMKYYKGICNNDKPYNGGDYVKKTGKANEQYNFAPVSVDDNKRKMLCGVLLLILTNVL